MRKTRRQRKLKRRKTVKRGGMLPLPSDAALKVSIPESSDNLLLTGGKRKR